ncbi:MAG: DUF882 domain-containing protein [Firmicutes bacterium]|nr:DUF882 domain-containing protein [Bacillota bacterium]
MTIKQKQLNLKHLGYYKGNIDGIWGNGSKEATKKFQKAYGLVVDGIFGANTEVKSIQVWKDIQNKLNKHGFRLSVDGLVGTNTINAIKDFQLKNDLSIDYIVGPKTTAKLNAEPLSWNDIKYFKKSEFTCKCGCGSNNISLELVKIADEVRKHFGKPMTITSGTRCSKHNKNVGGVSTSRHLSGKACDFYISGVSQNQILDLTNKLVSQGKLRYTYGIANSSAVHMDIL